MAKSDAELLADAIVTYVMVIADADDHIHPNEIAEAGDALRSAAFSARNELVRDAALLCAKDFAGILEALEGETPSRVLGNAVAVLDRLDRATRDDAFLDLFLVGHRIANAHGGGLFGGGKVSVAERRALTTAITLMGGGSGEIERAVANMET